ncbi:hypothetical protein MCOR21_009274 [Pyricularia oryzae]|uniref:Uncharacterized protein n=1 Tax=Pyricularia grisea TaxID=148305 RepID=A0ABQ8NN96_PYRGI|nr:hypothetical protein MCOR26_005732 [Pyricularia oryzae]KAI6299198.1 hypothetical protein MCOR33_004845 [Pyricularia grisea]KAI6421417.1 hypothetical protein MCOR21_009274 [Pyricularia oryzae]KAI6454284.1 hypothetical protein MCOR15_008315 [Pyricularia oryzae]KAI6463338.1 hypothetical protein MCOR18_010749 [Pyricularia oryzae]
MKFSILKGAVAALAICSDVVLSQLTATQIVRNIEQLELISLDLKAPATFVDYLTQAQLITLGHSNFDSISGYLAKISQVAKMTVDEMQGMEAIPPGAEADAILDAFRDFAKAHTTYFLSMSKAPAGVRLLLAGIMPMDNLLKADESSIDSLVLKLMETIPTGTGELKSYADNISGQRKMAIKAWDLNLAQKRSFGRAAFRQGLRV